jgi:hypothetical protein
MTKIQKIDYKASATTRLRVSKGVQLALLSIGLLGFSSVEALAQGVKTQKSTDSGTEHGSLSELGAKLSDPTSDVWALFTEFDMTFSRGEITGNDYKMSGDMIFQPIMPFHVTEEWKVLTRPTIPVVFGSPVVSGFKPNGEAEFDYKTGMGDISLPLLFTPVSKPGEALSVGFGPTFQFPTHSATGLGTKTWEVGPAFVASYKTKKITVGVLGQYWNSYSTYGNDQKDTSHGSILPFFYYNLPDAWQIGFNPTITYDDKATSGNQWNVPIGITVAKMTMMGKQPVKLQFGIEYAVERQDDYGAEWRIKVNIIPVIKSLQKKPWF